MAEERQAAQSDKRKIPELQAAPVLSGTGIRRAGMNNYSF
ncbi:hypothetical protein D083_2124 [Dickeya solani RNS 08.23.3.1.A]|nr:hypothetical protein D083_2124 [Dickeya solani RNS 08.23.3.1.A]